MNTTLTIAMSMQPSQANIFGNIHGGEIMKIMDTAAGSTAVQYARKNVVTARVDELQFLHPVHVGNFLTCTGRIVYVGTTSMEVYVTVDVENLFLEDGKRRALEAFFTMVALSESGRPTPVPPYEPETEEDRALYERVKTRRAFDSKRREDAKKQVGG
ncbi:MAG: acyl-CoA thioesterase [Clostridiales Family XIII bacterium]|jgi:acyl-CoA hydrolase|nr:acyl-CoA thioesterase [Clostridiales Family XIII bacterium]